METEDEGIEVSSKFLSLLILGVSLVFVGIVIVVVASAASGSGSVGGVIFIGPIPIVFGSAPNTAWLILIGIIIAVLSAVVFLVMNRRLEKLTR